MHSIHDPSRQVYTGSTVDHDPISSRLPLIGQLNPVVEERWRLSQGRDIAGFGSAPESAQAERRDDYVTDMEAEDDVYGSGIFDMSGSAGTVHPTLGVFSDHPSIPGYIGREVQFAVSREVTDLPSGGVAEVVVVPAGGMAYVERGGRVASPLRLDDRNNPYVTIHVGPEKNGRVLVGPGAGRTTFPPAGRVRRASDGGVATRPDTSQDVPALPPQFSPDNAQYGVAYQSSVPAVQPPGPPPGAPAAAPAATSGFGVAPMHVRRSTRRPFGADATTPAPAPASTPGWGTYAVAGAILGVGAAIFVGTVRMPTKKRRGR